MHTIFPAVIGDLGMRYSEFRTNRLKNLMSKTQINLMQLMPFGTSMSALLGFASLFLKPIRMEVKMKMQINMIEMLAGFGCARSLVTTQEHRSRIEELKNIRYQGCPVREVRFLLSSPIFNKNGRTRHWSQLRGLRPLRVTL